MIRWQKIRDNRDNSLDMSRENRRTMSSLKKLSELVVKES